MSVPTRPGDIPHNVPLRDLCVTYDRHALRIVEHRHGIGRPLTTERRLGHALAALAYQHALAERALYSRWSIATDALAAGASLDTVGAAMGWLNTGDRVGDALRWWAGDQHRQGLMDDARRDEVLRLAGGGQGGAR